MAFDDYVEPEVGIAVAVTAAITAAAASPPVRRTVRKGLVYGLAGLMMAGDRLSALARNAAQGAQQMASSAREQATEPAPAPQTETVH
jgi:hypothetical protein